MSRKPAPTPGQDQAEHQRSRGFVAAVAVWMQLIGGTRAMAAGEHHHEVADQVGQGVHAVGDQALGMRQQTHRDLKDRQHDIDRRH